MKCSLIAAGIAAAVGLAAATSAHASFILTLSSGTTTVTIPDNQPGVDQNLAPGSITYYGSIGDFSITSAFGYSNKPGTPNKANLQINSLNIRNSASGLRTLTVTLEDTDFTSPGSGPLQLDSALAGTIIQATSGDSVTFQSYADPDNTQGGTAITTGLQSALISSSALMDLGTTELSIPFTAHGVFSVKNVIQITLAPEDEVNIAGTTKVVQAIPEPASAALLAVAGLAVLRRAHRRAR